MLYINDTGLPVVTVMPSSQSVEVTLNATFTTMVTGVGSDDFTYQWRHSGTIISGETNSTLSITNVILNDTGMYDCTVMNQYGDSDSSSVSLTVTGAYVASYMCVLKHLRILYMAIVMKGLFKHCVT